MQKDGKRIWSKCAVQHTVTFLDMQWLPDIKWIVVLYCRMLHHDIFYTWAMKISKIKETIYSICNMLKKNLSKQHMHFLLSIKDHKNNDTFFLVFWIRYTYKIFFEVKQNNEKRVREWVRGHDAKV